MPVELLIAPPATGKTGDCIRRIRSLLQEALAPVRVVLPDRLQVAAFGAGWLGGRALGQVGTLATCTVAAGTFRASGARRFPPGPPPGQAALGRFSCR
jgi:hypothetical protein